MSGVVREEFGRLHGSPLVEILNAGACVCMRKGYSACLIFTLFACLLSSAFAQVANNTSLVGTILDPSGSPVSGVKVTAVNRDTRVSYPGTTNDAGYYAINFIAVGTYDITAAADGFKKITQTGVPVSINQAVRTDFSLQLGSVDTSVTVTAQTPPLSTDDATLAETLGTDQVANLPMNGRHALELAITSSNVIQGPKSSFTAVPPGEDFIGAGQREITNSLTLDGVSIMNNLITVTAVSPNPDAIQEVQVQNGNYTAQYGSYMGVHINLVSKSGGNKLHGSAYDYIQNDVFNARQYFNRTPATIAPLRYNQFGFELDGPVYLPWLYDGRDKTFFMASYEGLREINGAVSSITTMSQAMAGGDFSALLAGSKPVQLKNPFTTEALPNNQIPSNLMSPQALALLKYVPLATFYGANNYTASAPQNITINQTLDRVDENIGQNIRLFVRYDWQNMTIANGNVVPTSGSYGPTNNRNITIGYTHFITPNLVNDFRIGRNHLITNNLDYWYVNNLKDAGTLLGIPGFDGDTRYNNPGIPDITISGYAGLGNAGANWFQDDTTWHGYDQISYTHGKHNLMFGVELRKLTTGRAAVNSPRGSFAFSGASSGDASADFLMGVPLNDITPIAQRKGVVAEWRDGFFALDNWQVSQKLTLNYGLRYELPTVPYSVNGYARILNAAQTALIPDTVPDAGFKFIRPNHDNWAPRIGFAYRATEKTVVRGGIGAYYNPNQMNSFTLATSNPPFATATTYQTTAQVILTLANPTPGSAVGKPSPYVAVFTENPYLPTPRMYQWNLSVGNQLWKDAGFELQYLGSHSLHLDRSFYNNQPTPGPGDVNAHRPNQLWGQIRTIQNDEYSNYHGFTAIFRQRLTHGVQVNASYTWSHTLDFSSDSNGGGVSMNPLNFRLDYGNANWDIRNRFVGTVVYSLPKLTTMKPAFRYVFGGWQMNDITTIQGGQPMNVTLSSDVANIGRNDGQRPNWVHAARASCGTKAAQVGATSCIDSTAYSTPDAYHFGTAHRNQIYGPSFVNTDFSLFKDIPVKDRAHFEIRGELFNALNHPNLANPASNVFDTKSFGTFGLLKGNNRIIQVAGKFVF